MPIDRGQCEFTRITRTWERQRCKRNATTSVGRKAVCEQHAKIMLGLPPDIIESQGRPIVRADA